MKNKILIISLILLAVCYTKSQTKNPTYICKDCGNFDLNKIEFNENINYLTSKTKTSITAITDSNIEKKINEITSNDNVILYKYKIRNGLNQDLGKDFFNYNNKFLFNNLSFLVNAKKEIIGYSAYIDYGGSAEKIKTLISYLSNFLNVKPKKNILFADDSEIYQWDSQNYFYQLMKVEKSKNSYHIKLIAVKKDRMSDIVIKAIKNDETFLLFGEKSFKKI